MRDGTTLPRDAAPPSPWRAWCYLVWLSWQRQARGHLMVWVALGLLAFMTFLVAVITPRAWDWREWRSQRRGAAHKTMVISSAAAARALPLDVSAGGIQAAVTAAYQAALESETQRHRAAVVRFSEVVVFTMFTTFLLPLWCLSFATEALGREREDRNLLWLLTRPIPRPAIYLAKYVAVLPWAVGIGVGGLGLLCLAAGEPGWTAFALYWPAALFGTLAFCALFHLMGASIRRAAVVAILYSFFLETVFGNLPAYWKRASVSFYTRCLMYDAARDYGLAPERPLLYLPVEGLTAALVLSSLTVGLLALGAFIFSRSEYLDLS